MKSIEILFLPRVKTRYQIFFVTCRFNLDLPDMGEIEVSTQSRTREKQYAIKQVSTFIRHLWMDEYKIKKIMFPNRRPHFKKRVNENKYIINNYSQIHHRHFSINASS